MLKFYLCFAISIAVYANELQFPTKKQLVALGVSESSIKIILGKNKKSYKKPIKAYESLLSVVTKSSTDDFIKINSIIKRLSSLRQRALEKKYLKWINLKKHLSRSQLAELAKLQEQKPVNLR